MGYEAVDWIDQPPGSIAGKVLDVVPVTIGRKPSILCQIDDSLLSTA
jgi:hypothetical protein